MTDAEKQELIFLRDSISAIKNEKQKIETELATKKLELEYLNRWKKGRWYGFFILFIILCLMLMLLLPDILLFMGLLKEEDDKSLHAFTLSQVSGATMVFGAVLIFSLLILTMYAGIKLIAETGSSLFARKIAIMSGLKNYYRSLEVIQNDKKDVECELGKLVEEYDKVKSRLEYLEIKYECDNKN